MYGKQKEIGGHAAAIYSCIASGNYIYSASGDKFVARWKIDEGVQDNFSIRFENAIYSIELIQDVYLIVGLANGDIHVFDLNSKEEIRYFTQHKVGIFEIKYNAPKNQLYIADADGNLSIWDENFSLLLYLPLNCGKIRDIDIEKNGDHIVLGCQDGFFRVFETSFFNEVQTVSAHQMGCSSVLFSTSETNVILTGGKDAYLKKWNWKTGECIKGIPAHNYAIYSIIEQEVDEVAYVTASRDKTIKLWSTELNVLKRLEAKNGGHKHSVNKLFKLSEDSFISCSDDKRMIIWHKQG